MFIEESDERGGSWPELEGQALGRELPDDHRGVNGGNVMPLQLWLRCTLALHRRSLSIIPEVQHCQGVYVVLIVATVEHLLAFGCAGRVKSEASSSLKMDSSCLRASLAPHDVTILGPTLN